jgi:hypothetical protein
VLKGSGYGLWSLPAKESKEEGKKEKEIGF